MEGATGGRIQGRRHLARQNHFFPLAAGVGGQRSRNQGLSVRVQRIGEKLLRRTFFHNLTQVHHPYTVAHISDRSQVVGYEDTPRAWRRWRTPWPWSAVASRPNFIPAYVENTLRFLLLCNGPVICIMHFHQKLPEYIIETYIYSANISVKQIEFCL